MHGVCANDTQRPDSLRALLRSLPPTTRVQPIGRLRRRASHVAPASTPNPGVAFVLGLIPGVGAMYNGQLFKGLIHVVVFAILVSLTENLPCLWPVYRGVGGISGVRGVLHGEGAARWPASARSFWPKRAGKLVESERLRFDLRGTDRLRLWRPGQAANPQAGAPGSPQELPSAGVPCWRRAGLGSWLSASGTIQLRAIRRTPSRLLARIRPIIRRAMCLRRICHRGQLFRR